MSSERDLEKSCYCLKAKCYAINSSCKAKNAARYPTTATLSANSFQSDHSLFPDFPFNPFVVGAKMVAASRYRHRFTIAIQSQPK